MAGLNTTQAQTLYSQDFEGAYPWGMTIVDNYGGTGGVWLPNDAYLNTTYIDNYTGGTGFCASANSDDDANIEFFTDMVTPSIDLTSVSSASLTFRYNIQDVGGSGLGTVDISTDGGSTWTNIWIRDNIDDPAGGLGLPGGSGATINLTPYVGNNVLLRWSYDDEFDWAWYFQVDDIAVNATTGGGGGSSASFQTACGLGTFIVDEGCISQTNATASVAVSGLATLGGTTTLASVDIIIDHTWDSDLDIFLISPSGTVIELSTDNGIAEQDFGIPFGDCSQFTRFTMSATTSITAGTAPFLGDYLPEGDLNVVNTGAEDPNGNWTLRICDDLGGDDGTIEYFAVNFNVPPPPVNYCIPTVDFIDEGIVNFSLNTINNPSLVDPSGYEDYTSISTQLQLGVAYPTTISIDPTIYTADVMDVWVDLNANGDFSDPGELLINGAPSNTGISTANLIIPTGTALGTTRLRVAVRWADPDFGDVTALPCGIMQYGEYEDYTVELLAAPSCLQSTSLSVTNIGTTSATLNWNLVAGALSYDVQYREVGSGTWISAGTFLDPTNSTTISGLLPQTQYEFQVQTNCSPTDSSGYSFAQPFSTGCFDCPSGSVTEAETCGGDTNGGCNMVTPAFEPIAAGSTVCGTGWAAGGTRDTDWYTFTITQTSTVTLDIQSDFPPLIGFVDGGIPCANLTGFINSVDGTANCTDTSVTVSLCAGTYIAFVSPSVFDGYPCGSQNNYNITLTVTPGANGGPTNLTACTATPLTVGTTCTPQTFDNTGTVYCGGGAGLDPGCGAYAGQDVWFSAIVPATGSLTIQSTMGTMADGAMGIWDGNCTNPQFYACNDDFGGSLAPGLQLSGLTPGDTIWIQFFAFNGGSPGTFDLCVFDCNIPAGAITESEANCGDDSNGGCNSVPPAYDPLAFNGTVTGTAWSSSVSRDTDWFTYTITTATTVSWTVNADFPFAAAIIDVTDCNNLVIPDFVNGTPCSTVTASAFLQPGTYAFFVANSTFDDLYQCGSEFVDYTATLTIDMPTVNIGGPTSLCVNDGPVTYLANLAGGTWSTSTGLGFTDPVNGIFDPAVAGVGTLDIYYLVNINGGVVGDTLTVTIGDVPAQPSTPTGTAQVCPGAGVQTYTVTPVAGATSYNWIVTPTDSATVTGNGTSVTVDWGTYSGTGSVVVQAVNACGTSQASSSFDVTIVPAVGAAGTPSGPTTVCAGSGNSTYVTAGATGADTYTWTIDQGGVLTPNGTSVDVAWNNGFTGTATITVTPSNVCGNGTAATITVSVVAPGGNATITAVNPVCSNANPFQLSATPAGGTWSGGNYVSPTGVFTPSLAAQGNNVVIYTPAGGCSAPATGNVVVNTVPAQASTPVGPTAFCQGAAPFNVFAPAVQGATSYTWSFTPNPDAGTFTPNGTNGTITLDPDFCGQISVIIAAENTCGIGLYSTPLLIDVTCTPAPVIDAGGPYCVSNDAFPLGVDIPNGFWGGCADGDGTFTPSSLGSCTASYTVIVNGCVGTGTAQIQVNPAQPVSITVPSAICEGGAPVQLTGVPAGGTWSGNAPGGLYNPANGNGVVTYTGSGQFGCADGSVDQTITVTPQPFAFFSYAAQCEALTFYDESQNAGSWFWEFGDNDGSTQNGQAAAHVYNVDGEVDVTLTVANACGSDDTTLTVLIVKCVGVDEDVVSDLKLYPNPTSGLVNLFFNSESAKNYSISIVDITGKVLFNQALNNYVGAYNRELDFSNYASGIYMLRIMDESGKATNFKVIRD